MEQALEDKGLVGNLVAFDQEASAVGIHNQVEAFDQQAFDPEASAASIHNQEVAFTAVSNLAASGP